MEESEERPGADQGQVSGRDRPDVRQHEERLPGVIDEVAATAEDLAATFHEMADRALREGRLDDARRLDREAAAALHGAERGRDREERPREAAWVDARWRRDAVSRARDEAARRHEEAGRLREEAARRRDVAARLRDERARRRDAAALERDDRATDRAVAAGHRTDAAEERRAEEERWTRRSTASAGGREEQSAVDEEVGATYRGLAENDRRGAAVDRAADAADRGQAERDRGAAAEDREAALVDRREAAQDRMAAGADREQDEIDGETRC